jgi:hypothetical protein
MYSTKLWQTLPYVCPLLKLPLSYAEFFHQPVVSILHVRTQSKYLRGSSQYRHFLDTAGTFDRVNYCHYREPISVIIDGHYRHYIAINHRTTRTYRLLLHHNRHVMRLDLYHIVPGTLTVWLQDLQLEILHNSPSY